HSLEDPYNVDHPAAAAYAQEARIVAQAMGHKPQADYSYAAPPMFLFEPHQPEMCNFKPQVILNIDEVWDTKRKTFEILAPQKHLWAYYERVALQRGMQGGRNSGKAMTYGEAYQRLFPMALEEFIASPSSFSTSPAPMPRLSGGSPRSGWQPCTRPMAASA